MQAFKKINLRYNLLRNLKTRKRTNLLLGRVTSRRGHRRRRSHCRRREVRKSIKIKNARRLKSG